MNIKQIWVMWSAADLWYKELVSRVAYEVWKEIAQNKQVLVYGAEKDSDSLSATAARWAKSLGWTVMWVTYWKTPDIWGDMIQYTDTIVNTWMERWGWREYILVSSCDALIVVWGWSWTLNEITIAYQKKIPIVVIEWTGWWADKIANTYIDDRYKQDPDRYICKWVKNPVDAIKYLNSL